MVYIDSGFLKKSTSIYVKLAVEMNKCLKEVDILEWDFEI